MPAPFEAFALSGCSDLEGCGVRKPASQLILADRGRRYGAVSRINPEREVPQVPGDCPDLGGLLWGWSRFSSGERGDQSQAGVVAHQQEWRSLSRCR
jgi:hypothetical protein